MPKKIDPDLKARAVRLVLEHRGEYSTTTAAVAAVAAVAKPVGVGKESLRRWVVQAGIDAGDGAGVTQVWRVSRSRSSRPRTVVCVRTSRS